MKPKQRKSWERIRSRGMLRNILFNGVLAYGLPMFIVMTYMTDIIKEEKTIELTMMLLAIHLSGGAIFGFLMWFISERIYKNTNDSEE